MVQIWKRGFSTTQIIGSGFLGTILLGALLLMLPISTSSGEVAPFIDALFTSTSSVCVTGLVTVPVWSYWSGFGQGIIILLMQVGGLGVITFTTIVLLVLGRRISLKERLLIQDAYNLDTLGGLVRLTMRIVKGTLIVEGIGFLLYTTVFIPKYGLGQGLWKSFFNAVSAFCNAGLELIGDYSLTPFQSNPIINFTTMGLIVLGGLGFPVWWNILDTLKRRKTTYDGWRDASHHFSLHTKMVLAVTGILIFGGALLFLLMEFSNPATMGKLSFPDKLMASLFQSITTRTAGFFTISQGDLHNSSALLTIILMFIGGSPSGTAGGIKTTTLGILLVAVYSIVRGRKDTEAFGRKISTVLVKKGMAILVFSFSVLMMSVMLVSIVQEADFLDILFECTSAIGTVGLTRGITMDLTIPAKVIIIITMYAGRLGPITLALFFNSRKYINAKRYPVENVGVG